MPWSDEQIRQRKLSDDEIFTASLLHMAGAPTGIQRTHVKDESDIAENAIDEILKYYKFQPPEEDLPDMPFMNLLEKRIRPYGIMYRQIRLKGDWFRDAQGPMLAFKEEDHSVVALIPDAFGHYSWREARTGRRVRVDKETAQILSGEALCFYKPLPEKSVTIKEFYKYVFGRLTAMDILFMVVAMLAVTGLGMLMTGLVSVLTGTVMVSDQPNMFMAIAVYMTCVAVSTFLIGTTRTMLFERLRSKTLFEVEAAMMGRILSLPPAFFGKYSSGDLSKRSAYAKDLANAVLDLTLSSGLAALFSMGYVVQISVLTPTLALPALIVVALTCILTVAAALLQMRISRKAMLLASKESGMTYALIAGIQKIRNAGAEKRAFARWAELYAEEAEILYHPPLFLRLNSVVQLFISLSGTLVIYILSLRSRIPASEYLTFTTAFGQVSAAFAALAGVVTTIAAIRPMAEMIRPILESPCEVQKEKQQVEKISGAIEVDDVSFRYTDDSPLVLNSLSLKIRKGDYVALVGETGCGKSTLVRMLLGFETPTSGAIYYDGYDLKSLDPVSLRKNIGSVLQDGKLMMGDIYQNITLSAPWIGLRSAWEAAELAGIADDIRSFPMGMATMISEHGGVSGGQRQRILIARAVAPKPKLLIFDEATSALDNITQKKISEALDALSCTRIIIAHRLSTIKNCNRILVMQDGRITEDGTYDELIAKNGYFAELVERQRVDTPRQGTV